MAFIRMEGVCGKVFVPEGSPEPKKHPCPDCFECQQCSDDRCRVCLSEGTEDGAPRNRFRGEGLSCGKGSKGPRGQGSEFRVRCSGKAEPR